MKKLVIVVAVLSYAASAIAASVNLTAPAAQDIDLVGPAGGSIGAGAIDVFVDGADMMILNWRATAYNGFYQTAHELSLHSADGGFVRSLVTSTGTALHSFVCKRGDTVYYGLDANILSLSYSNPQTPTVAAVLTNNYDMQFDGAGGAYAVANPTWAENNIYKLDLTGGSTHTVVVRNAGIYSAELAFDSSDSLYYGTYGSASNELRRFTSTQLATAAGSGTALSWGDGALVSELEFGAGGIAVDNADNVVFTMNSSATKGLYVIEDGMAYTGTYQYEMWSHANYWTPGGFAAVDAVGDATAYTALADDAAFAVGGAGLAMVPEPAALALLGGAGVVMLLRRRGRMVR